MIGTDDFGSVVYPEPERSDHTGKEEANVKKQYLPPEQDITLIQDSDIIITSDGEWGPPIQPHY